jgi:nitroreductase
VFVQLEAGPAAQDILLQAAARGLAAVPVGSLDPARAPAAFTLPHGQTVLYSSRSASRCDQTGRTRQTAPSGNAHTGLRVSAFVGADINRVISLTPCPAATLKA